MSGYAASKHALAGFFDSLRIELTDCGVSVTMVYPSFVATRGREPGRGVIPVDTCAQAILKAAAQRKREVFIPPSIKVGLWIRLIVPWLFDLYAKRMMEHQDK